MTRQNFVQQNDGRFKCKHCDVHISLDHTGNMKAHLKQHAEISKQIKLQETLEKSDSKRQKPESEDKKSKKYSFETSSSYVIDCCVEMCTVNGRPLCIFEDSGFRKLAELIFDPMGITINRLNIKTHISAKAAQVRARLSELVGDSIYFLKADSASRHGRSVFGLNIQFYYKYKLRVFTLAMKEIKVKSTANNLKDLVLDTLKRYNLNLRNCKGFTRDNGANYVKTGKILQILKALGDDEKDMAYEDIEYLDLNPVIESILQFENTVFDEIPCWPHTLQLPVKLTLETDPAKSLLSLVDTAAKKLRCPTIKRIIDEKNLNGAKLRNATRWCSAYDEIVSVKELRALATDLSTSTPGLRISDQNWNKIDQLLELLTPVRDLTIKLQCEQLTPSEAFIYLKGCLAAISRIHNEFSSDFYQAISGRAKTLLEEPAVLAAVYFDLRFSRILSETERSSAIKYIEKLNAYLISRNPTQAPSSSQSENDTDFISAINTDSISSLEDMVDQILNDSSEHVDQNPPQCFDLQILLTKLRRESLDRKSDILAYWENAKLLSSHEYNGLAELALICLSLPVGQVSVERSFSGLKFILNDLRCNLEEVILEDILIVFLNDELFYDSNLN